MLLYLVTPGVSQLTPAGAAILRDVRRHLRTHPRSLNLTWWGSCLAAHIERQARLRADWWTRLVDSWRTIRMPRVYDDGLTAAQLLGFADVGPCRTLFHGYDLRDAYDVEHAIARIDLFLAAHGYPVDARSERAA